MKSLIPMNEFGLMADTNGLVRVDSRMVAERFGKNHKDVLRLIRQHCSNDSGYSREFIERNFAPNTYKDPIGRKLPCFMLTREGFAVVVMGFTGPEADRFKEWFVNRFIEMERQLIALQSNRDMHPQLMEAIRLAHKDRKPYHYSYELNMLNRIVTGMTAKEFREAYGLRKDESLRPHMTTDQLKLMDTLQQFDCGFVLSVPVFQERRAKLEWCACQFRNVA
jgi:Rha family phage regulatory protein